MIDLFPDLSLRQPSVTAVIPLLLNFYALAVLAILPNTFFFRLLLQPVLVWQACRCAARVDFSAWLALSLGLERTDSINFFNGAFVMGIFVIVLKSFEWTFIIKEPLRKYELKMYQNGHTGTMGQNGHTEPKKRLSISSVLLDAFHLSCNLRGIGWTWSQESPPQSTAPTSESIPFVFASLLFNITVFDASQYLIHRACPSVGSIPSGGSLFDPNLNFFPRYASAAFAGICGGAWSYSLFKALYGIGTLVGRVVLRQPASDWPPIFNAPWLSTSIHQYWSFRWHQLFRHLFIVFGARPGGALLGRPGAFMGAFAVSAALHHFTVWGVGNGSEFTTVGGYFLVMGFGAAMEVAFRTKTGVRVQGCYGWLWTMSWTLVWGTWMMDSWARHGLMSSVFFPDRLSPGKALVDAVIGLPK